jgi:biotin carboxyl carrier protein
MQEFKHPDDLVDVSVEGYDPFTVSELKDEDITIVERNGDKELVVIASGVKYKVKIVSVDFQAATYVLRINGKNFNCQARSHLHHLIGELGFNKASKNKQKDIHSPMPGLVLDILVKEGDQVIEGQNVMTLEAMKMENILKAPADGIISSIHTRVKSKVEKNELLISIS